MDNVEISWPEYLNARESIAQREYARFCLNGNEIGMRKALAEMLWVQRERREVREVVSNER